MRATKTIVLHLPADGDSLADGVHEVAVVVRELTVAEVRSALLTDEAVGDPLQALVFDGFGLGDLLLMSDASAADLEQFAPSELQPLVAACQKLNPHFFRVRAALVRVARQLVSEFEQTISTAHAAS